MVTVFVEILKLSVLLYVGFLNIRRYVLYLYIETLKQRLDAINQLRVDRALLPWDPLSSRFTVYCRHYYIIITR